MRQETGVASSRERCRRASKRSALRQVAAAPVRSRVAGASEAARVSLFSSARHAPQSTGPRRGAAAVARSAATAATPLTGTRRGSSVVAGTTGTAACRPTAPRAVCSRQACAGWHTGRRWQRQRRRRVDLFFSAGVRSSRARGTLTAWRICPTERPCRCRRCSGAMDSCRHSCASRPRGEDCHWW